MSSTTSSSWRASAVTSRGSTASSVSARLGRTLTLTLTLTPTLTLALTLTLTLTSLAAHERRRFRRQHCYGRAEEANSSR